MFKDDPAVGKMTKSALLAFLMRKYAAAPDDRAVTGRCGVSHAEIRRSAR